MFVIVIYIYLRPSRDESTKTRIPHTARAYITIICYCVFICIWTRIYIVRKTLWSNNTTLVCGSAADVEPLSVIGSSVLPAGIWLPAAIGFRDESSYEV